MERRWWREEFAVILAIKLGRIAIRPYDLRRSLDEGDFGGGEAIELVDEGVVLAVWQYSDSHK